MKTRNYTSGVENDFSFQYWEYEYYCIVKNESIKEFGWELCRFSLFRPFYTIRYHIILQIYRRNKIKYAFNKIFYSLVIPTNVNQSPTYYHLYLKIKIQPQNAWPIHRIKSANQK